MTDDLSLCPALSPYPPDWCDDGQIVSAGFSYVESLDGKYCKIPRTYCLSTDPTACPSI